MSLSETPVDSLAPAIANSGFWERMAYFLPLIRLLSIEEAFTLGQKLARLTMQRFQEGKGVSAPGLSLSWPDLIRFKRTFTDPVPEQTKRSFEQAGIITRGGRAHFVDRTSVQVGEEILVGRHVVIATGACHADLGIAGEDLLTTSTQFLDLEELPRRIV